MSDQPTTTPTTRLRPTGGSADQRPAPRPEADVPPSGRFAVPVRAVLLAGLAVLLLLAVFRPGGVAAVVGVPLAVVLPGSTLQPRFLPGLHTDVVTRWCLRGAVSLAFWALVLLAVGAAGIPVRSVWPAVVGVVLLAAVVLGEPERERRFGRTSARAAGIALVVLVVAAVLALAGRGLVAVGGERGTTSGSVVVGFTDPTVPVDLAPTGAHASAALLVTNGGTGTVHLVLHGQVGQALPWPDLDVDVAAGATRAVTLSGPVTVCADPQQLLVTVTGGGPLPPLATVLPGAAGGRPCTSA